MNRSTGWLGTLLVCALVLAACSSSGKSDSSPTTTVPGSTPGVTTPATTAVAVAPTPPPTFVYGIAAKGAPAPIQVLGKITGGKLAGKPATPGSPVYVEKVGIFGPVWVMGVDPAQAADGTQYGVTPTTTPPTTPPAASTPITQTACSLVTADDVKSVLGSSPAGAEQDLQDNNKTCAWSAGDSNGNTITMNFGVIRIGGGLVGFGGTVQGLTSTGIKGVGDQATYSTGRNSSGLTQAILVASKGSISVSISAKFGGTKTPPDSLQDDLSKIANGVFSQLGA